MSYEHEPISPMFRIDVSPENESNQSSSNDRVVIELLRQMVASQQQQNRMLEELVQQNTAANKQRAISTPVIGGPSSYQRKPGRICSVKFLSDVSRSSNPKGLA